jgi:hypothetical protein
MQSENPNPAQPPPVPQPPQLLPPAVPPQTPIYPPQSAYPVPFVSQFVPCPRCGSPYSQKVGYTWWGGSWVHPCFTRYAALIVSMSTMEKPDNRIRARSQLM